MQNMILFRRYTRHVVLGILLSGVLHRPASASEIWMGGHRAWLDIAKPENASQWLFLQKHIDGFYINNFAMRHKTGDPLEAERKAQLRQVYALLAKKRVFYETDLKHAKLDEDVRNIALFRAAGFEYAGATINYGTDPARTALLTERGQYPLYYMFGPWNYKDGLQSAKGKALLANISPLAGGSVDGPVTMWRRNAGNMHETCFEAIRWCHANKKKFLYLVAPNESGVAFLEETQKLVRAFEDEETCPDIWAMGFYGPPEFRKALETLPEKTGDGVPAKTFTGAVYWLMHHLRDPERKLQLAIPAQAGIEEKDDLVKLQPGSGGKYAVTVTNSSKWCDYAPLLRVKLDNAGPGWNGRWLLDGQDVTKELMGSGLNCVGKRRLGPGGKITLTLELARTAISTSQPLDIAIGLFSNRTEPVLVQKVKFKALP